MKALRYVLACAAGDAAAATWSENGWYPTEAVCERIGNAGLAAHQWTDYYCDDRKPGRFDPTEWWLVVYN